MPRNECRQRKCAQTCLSAATPALTAVERASCEHTPKSCDVRNKTSLCQNEQWPSGGVESEAKCQSEFHTVRDAALATKVFRRYISSSETPLSWTGTAASRLQSSATIPSTAAGSQENGPPRSWYFWHKKALCCSRNCCCRPFLAQKGRSACQKTVFEVKRER